MGNRYTYRPAVLTRLALVLDGQTQPKYKIAVECGMSPSRLSEYCNGRRHIPTHHLEALAAYLKVDVRQIMGVPDSEIYGGIADGIAEGIADAG